MIFLGGISAKLDNNSIEMRHTCNVCSVVWQVVNRGWQVSIHVEIQDVQGGYAESQTSMKELTGVDNFYL